MSRSAALKPPGADIEMRGITPAPQLTAFLLLPPCSTTLHWSPATPGAWRLRESQYSTHGPRERSPAQQRCRSFLGSDARERSGDWRALFPLV